MIYRSCSTSVEIECGKMELCYYMKLGNLYNEEDMESVNFKIGDKVFIGSKWISKIETIVRKRKQGFTQTIMLFIRKTM